MSFSFWPQFMQVLCGNLRLLGAGHVRTLACLMFSIASAT